MLNKGCALWSYSVTLGMLVWRHSLKPRVSTPWFPTSFTMSLLVLKCHRKVKKNENEIPYYRLVFFPRSSKRGSMSLSFLSFFCLVSFALLLRCEILCFSFCRFSPPSLFPLSFCLSWLQKQILDSCSSLFHGTFNQWNTGRKRSRILGIAGAPFNWGSVL